MNLLEHLFSLPTWEERIHFIRRSRLTKHPDIKQLQDDWFPERHSVCDKEKRKDMKTLVRDAELTPSGGATPPQFEVEPVARIALPIEQDITNIHVAFSVGNEPAIRADDASDKENDLLKVVRKISRDNKLSFQNKREMRSWLSETEVCEYWYRVEERGFWQKVVGKVKSLMGLKVSPSWKLRMQIWSPFRGDKLYPLFSKAGGDYLAIGREFEQTDASGLTTQFFMLVTDTEVHQLESTKDGWTYSEGFPVAHGFEKNPTIYAYRPKALCHDIRGARESLESLTSDWSDAIKMNFFPKLILEGDLSNGGAQSIGKSKLLKIENGGKAYYLDWNQTSDMVKSQIDSLFTKCYSLTNTPLIAFDQLQGAGQFPSGTAFDYLFMATLFAVNRHWEDMGEFFQRRLNFLLSAAGSLVPSLKDAAQTIDAEVEQRPYRIEDLSKRISDATAGVSGGVLSRKQGVMLVGITEEFNEELSEIEQDLKKNERNSTSQ